MRFVPFTWYRTGPFCRIEPFSIVCVSNPQICYSSIASSFFLASFFYIFYSPSASPSLVTSNCLIPPTYFTHQTHSDGITRLPVVFSSSLSPFFFSTCKAATEQGVQNMCWPLYYFRTQIYISHDDEFTDQCPRCRHHMMHEDG
jgi:hypothetical protein